MSQINKPLSLNFLLSGAIFALSIISMTACDRATSRIKEAINARWPPVSTLNRRAQALAASHKALNSLRPVVFLSLDKNALNNIPGVVDAQLASASTKNPHQSLPRVSKMRVKAEEEGVSVLCDFSIEIPDPAARVRGSLDGQLTFQPSGNSVQPVVAFNKIHVDDLQWLQVPVSADIAVPAINSILQSTLDNINGAIRLQAIVLALAPLAPLDPQNIHVERLKIAGSKVDMPIPTVSGVSLLAADGEVEFMADLRLQGEPPAATANTPLIVPRTQMEFSSQFRTFQSSFRNKRDETFGSHGGGTKAAVTRSFIATLLNRTVNGKALHLEYAFPGQRQSFNADIRPYSAPRINCDLQEDTRNCRPANPCTLSHDERSCGHDINVGGWNIIKAHVNDPICEAAKLAQNQVYLRSLDACNLSYNASIAGCEVAKAAQNQVYAAKKAACELDKSRLQVIEQLSHIGHISGAISGSGTAVADIHDLGVGPSLESISMETLIAGTADVVAQVKFDPDTAGRLACIIGWDKDLRTTVSVKQQPFPVKGTVTGGEDGNIVVSLSGSSLSIQLDPPPVQAIFIAHPELTVTCAPLVSGLTLAGLAYRALQQQDLPSEISGRYNISIPDSKFAIPLQTLSMGSGATEIKLTPRLSDKAAWFTAP